MANKRKYTIPLNSERLYELIRLRGWSAIGLSIQMGRPHSFVSDRLKNGFVDNQTIEALARLLPCDREELIGEKPVSVLAAEVDYGKRPTLEQVEEYCRTRHNGVDAQAFMDYYDERNWFGQSGKPIKVWRRAVGMFPETAAGMRKTHIVEQPKNDTDTLLGMVAELEDKVGQLIQDMTSMAEMCERTERHCDKLRDRVQYLERLAGSALVDTKGQEEVVLLPAEPKKKSFWERMFA